MLPNFWGLKDSWHCQSSLWLAYMAANDTLSKFQPYPINCTPPRRASLFYAANQGVAVTDVIEKC